MSRKKRERILIWIIALSSLCFVGCFWIACIGIEVQRP